MSNPIQVGAQRAPLHEHAVTRQIRSEQTEKPRTEAHVDKDPASAGPVHRNDFGVPAKIVTGRVQDPLGYTKTYKVQVDGGTHVIQCNLLGSSANSFMGARPMATLPSGTHVTVLCHDLMTEGLIIGCEADFAYDATKQLGDFIALGSNVGFKADSAHTMPFTLLGGGQGPKGPRSCGAVDWNAGRPFDSLTSGEWGHIVGTGARFFLDEYMGQVALNEATGLFVFYLDNMLRLAGANLQIRSGASEWEAFNDQSEFFSVEGFAPYIWEALGQKEFGVAIGKDRPPEITQLAEQYYGKREPVEDDLLAYHRARFIQGYLGQGGKRQLALWPQSASTIRYQDEVKLPGVFAEDIALTGRYSLRSAKAISIAKRTPIQIAKHMMRPDAKEGDNEETYKFAGVVGAGPDHTVVDELDVVSDEEHDFLVRATGVMDAHAYSMNWEANHAFKYHKKDWLLPDEGELELSSVAQASVNFGSLGGSQYLEPPTPEIYRVDDRDGYKEARYYPNESFFDLLEDGGIVIGDGFGSELRMTGGSVFISAPGDVWLKSGRNTNVWAGHDFIARGRNSVDLTATNKDVRIKSEHNMQLLAGNSGTSGGLLLESRGVSQYEFAPRAGEEVLSGGVMIKSTKANSIMWGKNLYLRSGVEGDGPPEYGEITLDANQGAGLIKTNCTYMEHFVRNGVWWNFCTQTGPEVGEVTDVYEFLPDWCSVPGTGAFDGELVANGHLATRGWQVAVDGHMASTGACDNPYVTCLEGKYLQEWTDWIDDATVLRQLIITTEGMKQYESQFTNWWYAAKQPGNNSVIGKIGVSMRKKDEYLTGDFTLYEDRWQRLARITGEGTGKWEEKAVPIFTSSSGGDGPETFPHPGKIKWKVDKALSELKTEQLEVAGGGIRAKGMDALKDETNFGGVKTFILDGNYRVVNK